MNFRSYCKFSRHLLGWSEEQTATALGIRPGTVKSRSHRAIPAGARRQSRRRRATMISTLAAVGALTIGTVTILNQNSNDKIIVSGGGSGEADPNDSDHPLAKCHSGRADYSGRPDAAVVPSRRRPRRSARPAQLPNLHRR